MKDHRIHLFGIRHHGPGSSRSVLAALERLQPDCILIEGPSDADALIAHVANPEMRPPVAILINTPIQKQQQPQAVFYPFAEFSPEWQAMRFAVKHDINVRFMDMPCLHAFALETQWKQEAIDAQKENLADGEVDTGDMDSTDLLIESTVQHDPIQLLATQAGYKDSERFWEHLVEQQPHAGDVFELIGDAMQAVRIHIESGYLEQASEQNVEQTSEQIFNNLSREQKREQLREAFMRKALRQAQKEGYERIAVVCGAWHVPALRELKSTLKQDNALLKGLPKVKTESAWIAWTHGRLNRASGYGAGIEAVGWYAHLWKHYLATSDGCAVDGEKISIDWFSRFAHALRQNGQDASSAQLIDAVQLIQSLLSLRGRHLPDLDDLQEVIVSVLHHGQNLPQPVLQQLLNDEKIGYVPDSLQTLPIQQDFTQQCKSLRFKLEAPHKKLELDLRVAFDLSKSQFLHCLNILGLQWASQEHAQGRGSYKEHWSLSWQPESALSLNEMSVWGNSIVNAANAYIQHQNQHSDDMAVLAANIEKIMLAGLDDGQIHDGQSNSGQNNSLDSALFRLDELSSQQHDPMLLMTALNPLASASRYGSVRGFDPERLAQIIQRFALRIIIALPHHCHNLNDEAAVERVKQLSQLNQLIEILDNPTITQQWQQLLQQLLDTDNQQISLHGYLHGWCCRIAREQHIIDEDSARTRFSLALSAGQLPEYSAAWFEGFMTSQALLMIHDQQLWSLVNQWLVSLPEDQFIELLPLLRRTTSSFATPERQQLAQKSANQTHTTHKQQQHIEAQHGKPMLEVLLGWLSLKPDAAITHLEERVT